jgi:hypothetical protein
VASLRSKNLCSGGFLTRLKAKAKNFTSSRELKKKEDYEVEVCPYNAVCEEKCM